MNKDAVIWLLTLYTVGLLLVSVWMLIHGHGAGTDYLVAGGIQAGILAIYYYASRNDRHKDTVPKA